MSLFGSIATTATIVTRVKSGTSSDGGDTFSESTVSVPAVFAPAGSTELVAGGDTVIEQDTFFLAPVAGLSPSAFGRIDYQGSRFEITGSPRFWTSPFSGQASGWEVPVKKVSG